jgi:gluconolactonase
LKTQVLNPEFHKIIALDSKFEQVITGFQFVEGPAWHPQEKSLIFSDILGNSIYQWSKAKGAKTLRRNSYMANGNTYDLQGRIITCEHATSQLTRTDFSTGAEREVLASHYKGNELNSPNDVVCKRDGTLYFTDPNSGRSAGFGVPREQELDFQGVYRWDARDLSLVPLVDDFSTPNTLRSSLDEKQYFVQGITMEMMK